MAVKKKNNIASVAFSLIFPVGGNCTDDAVWRGCHHADSPGAAASPARCPSGTSGAAAAQSSASSCSSALLLLSTTPLHQLVRPRPSRVGFTRSSARRLTCSGINLFIVSLFWASCRLPTLSPSFVSCPCAALVSYENSPLSPGIIFLLASGASPFQPLIISSDDL